MLGRDRYAGLCITHNEFICMFVLTKSCFMKKILAIAFYILLVHAGFSQVKNNFTKQDYEKFFIEDCIPKDLTANDHILMVQTPFREDQTARNAELDSIFKTYYKSPYIIVPLGSRAGTNTYDDLNIYKYAISFLHTVVKYGDNKVGSTHYELSIIDRLKMSKNTMPKMPEDLSKKEKQKWLEELRKNKDKYNIDLTAISKTGLEDNAGKISAMVTFLAMKLGKYKE